MLFTCGHLIPQANPSNNDKVGFAFAIKALQVTFLVLKLHNLLCGGFWPRKLRTVGAGDFCDLAWHSQCLAHRAFFSTVKYWAPRFRHSVSGGLTVPSAGAGVAGSEYEQHENSCDSGICAFVGSV